jgi:hypothetical protein
LAVYVHVQSLTVGDRKVPARHGSVMLIAKGIMINSIARRSSSGRLGFTVRGGGPPQASETSAAASASAGREPTIANIRRKQ